MENASTTTIIKASDEILNKLEDHHFATDLKDLAPLRGLTCATSFEEGEIDW